MASSHWSTRPRDINGDRARDELAKILEAFVAKEIQKYLRTFELEFYELMCEVRGEPLERAKKRPKYFGKLTNNLVYCRLALTCWMN